MRETLYIVLAGALLTGFLVPASAAQPDQLPDEVPSLQELLPEGNGGSCNGAYDTNCTCNIGTLLCEDGEPCNTYVAGVCVIG